MQTDINSKKDLAQNIMDQAEEINITTKHFKQYFVDLMLLLDTFFKQQLKSTKNCIGQVIYEDKEPVSIQIGNFQKYYIDYINQSQIKLNELESNDFNLENIKIGKKNIKENTKNSEKKLDKCVDAYLKNSQKYEKQSSEFKLRYEEYQKSQKTGYNITLFKKQESKIRVFVQEIEQQEQSLQQTINDFNSSVSSYKETLKLNFNSMKVLFSESVNSVLLLVKQFAIAQNKITETVIQQLESNYLPYFLKIGEQFKLTEQQILPEMQVNEVTQDNLDNLQLSDTSKSQQQLVESSNTILQNSSQTSNSQNQFSCINFVLSLQKALDRFEIQTQNQSDESIRSYYFEQVKAIIEKFKKMLEDRSKNAKILKQYLGELCESYDFIQKNLVKHMANKQQTSGSKLSAKFTEVLNVLQFIVEGLSEAFKYISIFINQKQNSLNGIINEYSNMDKALVYLQQLMLKNYQQNDDGIYLQKQYQQMIVGSLKKILKQENVSSLTIYTSLYSIFQELLKMQQKKQQFLQKAIDNVLMSQDEVQDQIKSYFTKDQHFFDVQEQKQNNQQDFIVFKKLFNLPDEFKQDYIIEQQQKQINELNIISSPLKDSIKQQDSLKISDSLLKKFNVPQNDFVVDSYSCSNAGLHGKIYIFNTMIGFISSFNSKTLFGDTVLVIPFNEIKQIDKKAQALIFDNAISITTKKGTLTFTSFMNRDRCYRLIKQQIAQFGDLMEKKMAPNSNKKVKKNKVDTSDSEDDEVDEEGQQRDDDSQGELERSGNTNENQENPESQPDEQAIEKQPAFPPILSEELKQSMLERKQKILSDNPKHYLSNKDFETFELVLENTHTREVFIEIFSDKQYKDYQSFSHFYQQTYIKDTNIDITPWQPAPSSIYTDVSSTNYQEFLESNQFSTKTNQFIHPVREKVPMGPKTCQVNSEEKIFWLSSEEILIQREFKVSKVPMADCFTTQNFYHIQQTGPTTVKITFGFFINFVKSSMFKSLIVKSSGSENRETWNGKFKGLITEQIKFAQNQRASVINQQKKQKTGAGTGTGKSKPVKFSQTDKFIEQNQQSLESLNAITEQILNIDNSVNLCNEKQQAFVSQQKIFFYLLIGILAINFLSLFK
ncbi:GRAM domain protein (macronuclear) [Tetrahymena thermophila SB210]|uniref:GRAM domain protein n=1 Tax=Tetrahymena thermophila (strain SB210) TaxID=312017 RepID=I7MCY9_TETTS|nr:GRAM domain protein [Tetrahymena thermophila SB210]EAR85175.2 GRAM domain protein [Tetrahymena thermophila SB210]|eukprot:XP_001032838.2 GRAM domain protein [Tetrahymena thermophila SB210]